MRTSEWAGDVKWSVNIPKDIRRFVNAAADIQEVVNEAAEVIFKKNNALFSLCMKYIGGILHQDKS